MRGGRGKAARAFVARLHTKTLVPRRAAAFRSALMSSPKPAVLALEDGSVFRGLAFGAAATVSGECVFNTSMDRLPGNPHRSLLLRPDRHHDRRADRQLRRHPRGRRGRRAQVLRLRRPRALPHRQQLAQPALARRLPRALRHPRHQRNRHPRAHEETPRRWRDEVLPQHAAHLRRRRDRAREKLARHGRRRLREGRQHQDPVSSGRRTIRKITTRPTSPSARR